MRQIRPGGLFGETSGQRRGAPVQTPNWLASFAELTAAPLSITGAPWENHRFAEPAEERSPTGAV